MAMLVSHNCWYLHTRNWRSVLWWLIGSTWIMGKAGACLTRKGGASHRFSASDWCLARPKGPKGLVTCPPAHSKHPIWYYVIPMYCVWYVYNLSTFNFHFRLPCPSPFFIHLSLVPDFFHQGRTLTCRVALQMMIGITFWNLFATASGDLCGNCVLLAPNTLRSLDERKGSVFFF